MKTVFLLEHSYETGENGLYDETKMIGVYSSKKKAEEVVEKYKKLLGFRDYQNGFSIDEYVIDEDNWTEGFITWTEASEKEED